jgi:hypothetical protein
MLKRIILSIFVLSALALIMHAPIKVDAAPENTAKLQETLVVTIAVVTAMPTDSSMPPAASLPMSTMIIFGLLVVLGLAVIVGGMALMRPRE